MTYTEAILQLIDAHPEISSAEIDRRLCLEGRCVKALIWPYIRRGQIAIKETRVASQRKPLVTFSPVMSLADAIQSAKQNWAKEELETLIALYPNHSNRSIAEQLGRTIDQIRSKSRKLKLQKSDAYRPKSVRVDDWTEEELQALRIRYPDETSSAVAESLGRAKEEVLYKANKIGLRKSIAFWKNSVKNIKGTGVDSQFRWVAIGTERIRGGYIRVKVREGLPWECKQQIVWRAHHGDYDTKTHTLWFVDRDPLNCDISNLELITKSEMMKRTTIMKYPKELRDVITLHNKLKKRLNEQHRDIT